MENLSFKIDESATAALKLVAEQADLWGADWEAIDRTSGKIGLPISAGLRRGWMEGTVSTKADGPHSSCIFFEMEHDEYRIDRGSVMILSAAALGCLGALVAVFFPRLLPIMPVCIMLAFGAYLVVIARLRNSGPQEFFETVIGDASAADTPSSNRRP